MDLENPHAGQGSVLLDIGGDIGALVVMMPEAMVGEEIEIVPEGGPLGHGHDHDHGSADGDHSDGHGAHGHDHEGAGHGTGHRPHVAVVARPVVGGQIASLVFPELVEGSYHLVSKGGGQVHLTAHVRGGEVTTADWPQ
jgi:hypothetical protein